MIPQDLQALAAGVITVLAPAAPYLVKALESAASQAGKDAWQAAHDLYNRVHGRFAKDGNKPALDTLQLFLGDPQTFEEALSKLLLVTLQKHPEWAVEVRGVLAQQSLQEIVARNQSHLERVTQSLSGAGVQRMTFNRSSGTDIRQEKKP